MYRTFVPRFAASIVLMFLGSLAAPNAVAQTAPALQPDVKFLDVYRNILKDQRQSLKTRIRVCHMIGQLGPDGKPAVPELLAALTYSGKTWHVEKKMVPDEITELLEARYYCYLYGPVLQQTALSALQKVGAEAKVVVPALIESLERLPRNYQSEKVVLTGELAWLFPDNPLAPRPLAIFPYDRNPFKIPPIDAHDKYVAKQLNNWCIAVVNGLQHYGPEARAAVPMLVKLAHKKRPTKEKVGIPGIDDDGDSTDIDGAEDSAPAKNDKMEWLEVRCQIAAIETLGRIASAKDSDAIMKLRVIAAIDPNLRSAAAKALQQIELRKNDASK